MESKTEPLVKSKEYHLILYLISKYEIVNVEKKTEDNGKDFLEWSFPCAASVDEQKYNRGEPLMINIHDVRNSTEIFKRHLQFYKIR